MTPEDAVSSPTGERRNARRPLHGGHCQCAGCGAFFNSLAGFEMHRVGTFGVDRRCLTGDEMLAAGMAVNRRDWWVTKLYDGPSREAA